MTTTDARPDRPLRHITDREFAKLAMLEMIATINDRGHRPSKADLTRNSATATKQARYSMVDTLIHRGLVRNEANVGGRYALLVTAWGREELARHRQ